jgi:DNA-binding NtrC family response regulator
VRILIASPDRSLIGVSEELVAAGYRVDMAREEGGRYVSPVAAKPNLALIDMQLGEDVCREMMTKLKEGEGHCSTVLAVDSVSPDSMAATLRWGADTLVLRSIGISELTRVIELELAAPKTRNHADDFTPLRDVQLLGQSSEMGEVARLIVLAAPSGASVLVTGETGTGKELIARALHRLSPRRNKPFVAVNCAAIPETLLEAELFGHEKGAFTGAANAKLGRFELADGGVIFLDEVGELPPAMQVKLLRALQERTFERLGGTKSIHVDVRVVAATNRSLVKEVETSTFRADLFYRLNVLSIHVPPLRERPKDVLPLWQNSVDKAARSEGKRAPRTTPQVASLLLGHDWPGNVRELENVALHAVTMSNGRKLSPTHLPSYLADTQPGETRREIRIPGMTLRELEREAILRTYEAVGTAKGTAEVLGISLRKVHYRLKEYREEGYLPPRGAQAGQARFSSTELIAPLRPRLLLAEDDDELRWALEALLEGDGYEVLSVASGNALMEHLPSESGAGRRPDVIVTDLRMPGINGLQVLEGARKRGVTSPVILISAFGDEETRAHAERLGATAFLDKPLDIEELQHALQRVVPPVAVPA